MIVKNFGQKLNIDIAVALGFFDSVHIGHRAVISKAINYAKANNIKSAIITYSNNPFGVLGKNQKLIFSFEERLEKLKNLGVDIVIVQEFDQNFMQKDRLDFVHELTSHYNIKYAVCGQDYRFGKGGQGDVQFLNEYFQQNNVEFEVLDFITENHSKVSSTIIRKLIETGEIKQANNLLVEPFFISGKVTQGKGKGKLLGFPTVNLNLPVDKVKIRQGVYITKTIFEGSSYLSITNVGSKPTFLDNQENIETHILDYEGNLYNHNIKVEFYEYLRPTYTFENQEQLIAQLKADIQAAKDYFRRN